MLAQRLQAFTRLSRDDCAALDRISGTSVRHIKARNDIVSEGERPLVARLILDGWACRYKSTEDGRRQIVGFFLPGDFCDLNVYILRRMDHSVGAITRVRVATISPEQMNALMSHSVRITHALWWHELVGASIQREWLLNVGQRTAFERVGHLLLELFVRLRTVGLVTDGHCDFPVTQTHLADATGLTPVHVNRTLQDLRAQGLIRLERRHLHIPDPDRLTGSTGFNPDYLHLDHEGSHLDANA